MSNTTYLRRYRRIKYRDESVDFGYRKAIWQCVSILAGLAKSIMWWRSWPMLCKCRFRLSRAVVDGRAYCITE